MMAKLGYLTRVVVLVLVASLLPLPSLSTTTSATATSTTTPSSSKANAAATQCPKPCQCSGQDNVHVDCSRRGIWRPPKTSAATLTLDLSGNRFGPVVNATFVHMRNLTDLDLSDNGLQRLQGCTLNGLFSLRRLSLRGNRLSSLPSSLFTDSDKLEILDLSHNLFAEIPHDAFLNTPNLKHLDLSHNQATELRLGGRFQVPRHLAYLDLSYNLFEAVTSDSFHMASQWEASILRTLKLSYCRISSIASGALLKIPKLSNLDLSGNPEMTLENLTATIKEFRNKRLDSLSLAHLNLTDLSSFFTDMPRMVLKFLNVSHNHIASTPSGIFATISGLEVLDLSHNRLTALDAGIKDLEHLLALNMSSNALTEFKGTAATKLKKLEDLDVSNNRLSQSRMVKFRLLKKLKRLKASDNLLRSVVLPSTTNNLVDVDFSSNAIREFDGFTRVPMLERFDISDNELEKVKEFLFGDAKFVKVANFSRNSVTEVDPLAFKPHSPLAVDLSHNDITRIKYSNWPATQWLHLAHNQIEDVDLQTFQDMTGLRGLDLSSNNITTLHENLFDHTSALESLNLSDNGLDDQVPFKILFRNLGSLLFLDLGGNNISELNDDMLESLHNLQRLLVPNNNLHVIMPKIFNDMTHIREIDLSNNPFSCICDMLAFRDWLSRTQVPVTGLYNDNSSAYLCLTPASRAGRHVMKWVPGEFECDDLMLYMIVFGSVGATLIVAGVVSTVIHRACRRSKRKREEKRKASMRTTIDFEDLLRPGKNINNNSKHMTSEEIAEEITGAIERRERRSMREAERYRRTNGYVQWPGGKNEGDKAVKEKVAERRVGSGGGGGENRNEAQAKNEKGRERTGDRHYEPVIRTDDSGRIELINRRGDRGAKDRRGGEEVRRADHGIPSGVSGNPRSPYDDYPTPTSHQAGYYRAEPYRRGGEPYTIAHPPQRAPPPGNRWDSVEVWDRNAGRWVVPGHHRRSRSQGPPRYDNREEQRYMTMPVREQDYYRARSQDRGGRQHPARSARPATYADHYTNEVRYGVEDLHRYHHPHQHQAMQKQQHQPQHQQRRSRRDLHESRSRSYHNIPGAHYRSAVGDPREVGYGDEGPYWTDDRRPLIASRAASQPFLASEWL